MLLRFFSSFSARFFAQVPASELTAITSALQDRNFAQALVLLRSALQKNPSDAQLWAMEGVANAGEGHKQEALASFLRALTISPDYLSALRGAAQIEFDEANSAAIPILKRLLRLQPADATGHGMLAVLQYQEGNCDSAVPHFEKAGTLFDAKPSALHAYAACLVKQRKFDQASNVFQRALTLQPSDKRERRLMAAIQLMAHQPQKALATLEPLLEETPDAETWN
jgi:cytochrome c-type biogenesis protein CcmH/NrfG